jgi:hypothetical protein
LHRGSALRFSPGNVSSERDLIVGERTRVTGLLSAVGCLGLLVCGRTIPKSLDSIYPTG